MSRIPSYCKPSLLSANEYWVHWLNRLEDLWNSPFLPVPKLIVLEILSAVEFFFCEEETLYAATHYSGTINRHIFPAVLSVSNFFSSSSFFCFFFFFFFFFFSRAISF
jgi:hypothetical protein